MKKMLNSVRFALVPLLVLAARAGAQMIAFDAPVSDRIGVNTHFAQPEPGEMDVLAAVGCGWIRQDLTWNATELKPGVYDFSDYDDLLADLEANGMRVLMTLDYTNGNYDGGMSPYTDAGRAAFARWAVAAAEHFKGRGILWEVYNEPNGSFWKPEPNANDYAKLVITVGEAFRRSVPDEILIGPACGGSDGGIDYPFFTTCFQAGCLKYWSAVTMHPYRGSMPETAGADFDQMRALIKRYSHGKSVPVMSGEWGYSVKDNFTEEQQAQYFTRMLLGNIANGALLSIWYDWEDDATNPDSHFGLLAYTAPESQMVYEPKPAYYAAQTLTRNIGELKFVKRINVGAANYVLQFGEGTKAKYAIWTTLATPQTITLPVGVQGEFAAITYMGDQLPVLKTTAKKLRITLTEDPIYLQRQR